MVGGRQIRGFENNGIGPRMPNGDAIGGTTYFTASAEVTFPMPAFPEDFGLRAALFADAGTLHGNEVSGASGVVGTDAAIHASVGAGIQWASPFRSEEHTSELQSLMRISYAVFCLKKK